MISNYFKTTLRALFRNRMHTIINVFGLSLGITCSLVLFLLAQYSISYDDFQKNKDRIYRLVNSSRGQGGEMDYTPGVPVPLPDALREDFPEFEKVVFTSGHYGEMLFTINPGSDAPTYFELDDDRIVYTGPEYFEVFTSDWLEGNREMALRKPNSVILSRSLADKFFPDGNALGKTVVFNKQTDLQITGVVGDPPPNTDMPFKIFISLATLEEKRGEGKWNSVSSDDQCYLLMAENDNPGRYTERLAQFVVKHFGEDDDDESTYHLQPMSDLHYNEHWSGYTYSSISKNQTLVMVLIGIFLLLTACINFVNLSTAVAVKRSREVGIRKVLGGTRRQLIFQFMTESFGIILLSVIVALGLAELGIIYLNPFLEIYLDIDFTNGQFIMSLLGGTLLITILAGFYPAVVLSGFKPALALKSKITSRHSGGLSLRKGLVVFQFFISQVFIIGTIITLGQLEYIKNVDLGFRTDALINVRIPEEDPQKKKTLKNELNRLAGVQQVSLLYSNPSSGSVSVSNFSIEENPEDYYAAMKFGDENYLDIYQMEILAGRGLRESDTLKEVVVNERLLKYVGHDGSYEEAVGKQVKVWGKHVPVVGVVKDFHSVSLHDDLMTIMIFNHLESYRKATIKVDMAHFEETNAEIRKIWKSLYPEFDYEHRFVDEQLAEFYEDEQEMSAIFTFFSGIAILIGCLGLFGLASFMINQKVKEIGIRKVLGATVSSIVSMFSISFFKLIGLAFLLAVPVTWYVMGQWLQNFQYKIELGPLFFIAGLLATLLIAVITVGYKSMRAATANPVDSLRNE